ncbi:MAG TPA: NAD-glutamate dehydrogenase [Hyphomicrobiaceae bacterium]|nr:NAD-glutamate dehydrogenase [Hyphomicrobiaceae bacterium]
MTFVVMSGQHEDCQHRGIIIDDTLRLLGRDTPLARFASLLYGDGPPDGLADDRGPVSSMWLSSNAEAAFAFLAEKPTPGHKVRVRRMPADGVADGQAVIEILNDDMPFLVDSVLAELQARGLVVRELLHPILKTSRDASGRLEAVLGPGDQSWRDGHQESYIAIYLGGGLSQGEETDLIGTVSAILDEVRIAVADWQPMVELLKAASHRLRANPPKLPPGELGEAAAFLHWLAADNFTFLGAREYRLSGEAGRGGTLLAIDESGLGILRNPAVRAVDRADHDEPADLPVAVGRARLRSRVHRRIDMHCVAVRSYRPDGSVDGETLLVGLFTSQAYTQPVHDIPLLRHKVQTVLRLSGHPAGSHDAKALTNVLETFPRDELLQLGVEDLKRWCEAILDLEIRPRVRVLARVDRLNRFVTLLVYVPRDRYNSSVRERVSALFEDVFGGSVTAFYPYFTDAPLVRVQFIVSRVASAREGRAAEVDTGVLESRIEDIIRTWDDRLVEEIAAGDGDAEALLGKYRTAFPADYAATFPAERALHDIARIERLGPQVPVAIDFYRDRGDPPARLRAAVYRFGDPISLSERVPLLGNLGFRAIDERSYVIEPQMPDGARPVTLHDMTLETADGVPIDLSVHAQRLEACFLAVFSGAADNDNFNRLVVSAGVDWRSVAALRACAAYLRQLGVPFGPRYIADTLHRYAGVARDLVELFHLRFDPDLALEAAERKAAEEPIRARIEGALADVPSLDEDRILRLMLNLIGAIVRTNFYQERPDSPPPCGEGLGVGGTPTFDVLRSPPLFPAPTGGEGTLWPASHSTRPATIAFKFDSRRVDAAPQPRPFREIWVYSPRVEGIHLRFAPIARGGIRWSDRAQDFRTEVLGLARAQLVKNAVIVPSGAKGGFLPKQLPRGGSRDEVQKEGIAAYRLFISALLDLTDNLVDGVIVPPRRVVRHDGDDAYLVVAADKGTASFSDIANEISKAHDFWLGDAFASGGSAGYDHKRMGITARGAWECVKRHFREMDIDIQRQPFRVVGVGDMSGDVFGNGMLLSQQIRLMAAFDHRDIFIDPDPDAAVGFAERQRLFDLPRSSWQDYDRARISKGGGVFPRSAKAITLTPEMQALLGLVVPSLTPNELIRAILKCEADLLWFGGIGTYVRASSERDADVGDRTNDPLRVTAAEVRAKVIGEGANLGVTQRARIELARRGGRVDTDFIDNSAGVNTSDQEVNIKIALQPAVRAGALAEDQRRQLLAEMTGDVAAASLRNNYQQSLALSLAERSSARNLPDYAALMRTLEAHGLLDRALEALPSDMELQERGRAGRGLTRPELAVLMSYAKIALQADLLKSPVPGESQLHSWLTGYFPPLLRERFAAGIDGHSLRREIVALGLTNAVVNRGGPAMAVRLAEETGRPVSDVALAFMAVREVFDLTRLWARIDALDGEIGGELQLRLYEATQQLVNVVTRQLLRSGAPLGDLAGLIARHKAGLAALAQSLDEVLPPDRRDDVSRKEEQLAAGGIPGDLARDIARLQVLVQGPDITEIAAALGTTVPETACVLLEIGERLSIDRLAQSGSGLPTGDQYDRLAVAQAMDQLASAQRAFTREALHAGGFEAWLARQGDRPERIRHLVADAAGSGALTLSRLLVAVGALRDLVAPAVRGAD